MLWGVEMFVVVVLVLVVISTPHSPAGATAPDAMRVERAGAFAQTFRGVVLDRPLPGGLGGPLQQMLMKEWVVRPLSHA